MDRRKDRKDGERMQFGIGCQEVRDRLFQRFGEGGRPLEILIVE